jgi:hypothetical protein
MQQCIVAAAVGIAAAKCQMYSIYEHGLEGIMDKKKCCLFIGLILIS